MMAEFIIGMVIGVLIGIVGGNAYVKRFDEYADEFDRNNY